MFGLYVQELGFRRFLSIVDHTWCKFTLRSSSIFVLLRRNEKRGPILARLHERECMRTAKIGPDLSLVKIPLSEAAVEASGH